MAKHSVEDYSIGINKNALTECLLKVEALSYFSLTDAFLKSPVPIKHDYLWAMGDLICVAKDISERLL